MDRLDEFEIFIAILDTGSLAQAGRKLRRSPPAITRALTTLEERIGTRLIERTTRQLAPTEAGRRLEEQARRLLADYETAVCEDAGAPPRGLLRVTAPTMFGRRHVAPLVNAYLDRYPGMQAELILNDRNLDLIDEGLDAGIRIGPLADAGIVARQVGKVTRILVASPSYLARRGRPNSVEDLASHDVIFNSPRSHIPEWRFRHGEKELTVQLAPRMIVNDVEAALLCVRAGRGMGRMQSYQVIDDLASGALVRLLPEYEPAASPVHVVVSSARHMASKLRAFVDHAVLSLEQLPAIHAEDK